LTTHFSNLFTVFLLFFIIIYCHKTTTYLKNNYKNFNINQYPSFNPNISRERIVNIKHEKKNICVIFAHLNLCEVVI